MTELNYLNRREASRYLTDRGLRVAPTTLAKLACTGGGPTFQLFGRLPCYTVDDLDEWAKSKLTKPRRSTSDWAA